MKKTWPILFSAMLFVVACAAPPPATELAAELPAAEAAVSTAVEIEPEVVDLGGDCGDGLSAEECVNSGEHLYLQFVEADNVCNDDNNDEIVQFIFSFSAGQVLASDVTNGETRQYANIGPNLYSFEKTFENGWVDSYVIEFTPAGFTEVYEYTDPDLGETLPCYRITRTLDDA